MSRTRYQNGKRVIERWDTVFTALSAEPRRQLIVSLMDAPQATAVPLPESAATPNVPPDPDVLRQELYHCHLPMLAEMEFITWDTDPLVAARGPRFEQVATVFELLHAGATDLPDPLVTGCQRLEQERQQNGIE